jgi:DNA-binding NarL/FixJ family response regulator
VTPIRVLIVDDHPMVREGLKALVGTQSDMEVVAEAGTSQEAISLFQRLSPDVTLLDLRLPNARGAEVISALLRLRPGGGIVVVTVYGGDADVRSALDAGARGYILKDAPREEIFAAVRAVAAGRIFICRSAADRLAASAYSEKLTDREAEVLELITQGRSNREIARALDVSVGTVKTHVHNILAKLEVRDRAGAVSAALQRGLVRQS